MILSEVITVVFGMVGDTNSRWDSVEQVRATAFLVGGAIFLGDTALLLWHMSAGTEPAALGQALVGASWAAAFIGMVGFYPSLVDGQPRLAKAGAVFGVIGGLTMAGMAVLMAGYATDVLTGEPGGATMVLLPGVFVGIVLGFGLYGVACLRSDIYTRPVGLLFLLLPATFLFNLGTGIAGFNRCRRLSASSWSCR